MTAFRLFLFKCLLSFPRPLRKPLIRHFRFRRCPAATRENLYESAPLLLCNHIAMCGLVPGDIISDAVAQNGFYDWPHTQFIVKRATKASGGLFVDVGANLGYFSLLWSGLRNTGKVVAYEASPRNLAIFNESIASNGLAGVITLVPKALGDHKGMVTFDIGSDEQTGWGGISKNASSTTISVPIARLDEEMPDTRIDLLKIDVEGADTWVLLGCEGLLTKRMIKLICFEQNQERMAVLGIAAHEAPNFLRRMGYECRPLAPDEGEWIAFPSPA